MTTISLEDAQARLPELVGSLARGEELAIMQGEKVVARLVGECPEPRGRLKPGFAKGIFSIVAEDDDHLKDFAEYMP